MFWQSVVRGLGMLLHWQTYVVVPMSVVISLFPIIVVMYRDDKVDALVFAEKNAGLMMKRINGLTFFRALFHALAVFVSVCILFPIMLGGDKAAWSLPWVFIGIGPFRALFVFVSMFVLSLLGGSIRLLGGARSSTMFFMGGVVLAFLVLEIHQLYPELGVQRIEIVPEFLTVIGILIISGFASWLSIYASVFITKFLFRYNAVIGGMIMLSLNLFFGFLPVFIYAAWIGFQIQGVP